MTATLELQTPRKAQSQTFETALQNVTKVRPRFPVDTWNDADAAKFWLHDYDPADPNAIPPQIITGIVARLFVKHYLKVPPMGRVFRQWVKMANIGQVDVVETPAGGNYRTMPPEPIGSWESMARIFHLARRFKEPQDLEGCRNTGIDSICNDSDFLGYCNRKSCKYRDSLLTGCVRKPSFDALKSSGYIVPWSSVKWDGFGCLVTPLRKAHKAPVIVVRHDRKHTQEHWVPFWVADGLESLHRIVPNLMLSYEFRNLVSNTLRSKVEAVFSERFRFSAMLGIASDSNLAMWQWDLQFSTRVWDLGTDESPYEYVTFAGLGQEYDDALRSTCPSVDDLFGTVSES